MSMFYGARARIFRFAGQLRYNPTPQEEILWKELGAKKFMGFRFKRQHPIDRFIADFYCHKLKLVIEIDGEIHNYRRVYDDNRTVELKQFGIKVVRFTNKQIEDHLPEVLSDLAEVCNKLVEENIKTLHDNIHKCDGSPSGD